ncbi:MAG: hypothetical protein ACO3RV_09420, partial [Luteolibacter sp.]
LMLAAQEVLQAAIKAGADEQLQRRLIRAYYSIQRGLGFRKSPERFGAFPAEPYSHSPAEGGARQPGLTGQVKEGILCRLGELGLDFDAGKLCFAPRFLRRAEFGDDGKNPLEFSIAGTPVRYQLGEKHGDIHCTVILDDGQAIDFPNACLDASLTHDVIHRSGRVHQIDVTVPLAFTVI